MSIQLKKVMETEIKATKTFLKFMKSEKWKKLEDKDLRKVELLLQSYVIRNLQWNFYKKIFDQWIKNNKGAKTVGDKNL